VTIYRDNNGKEWTLRLTVAVLQKLDAAGIKFPRDQANLANDYAFAFKVLQTCVPQADWPALEAGFEGEAMSTACESLAEELILSYPKSQREAHKKLRAAAEAALLTQMQRATDSMSSPSASVSPGPLDATPENLPGASSFGWPVDPGSKPPTSVA